MRVHSGREGLANITQNGKVITAHCELIQLILEATLHQSNWTFQRRVGL
jgi:hypothetical protein